jgi:hypothetical protein
VHLESLSTWSCGQRRSAVWNDVPTYSRWSPRFSGYGPFAIPKLVATERFIGQMPDSHSLSPGQPAPVAGYYCARNMFGAPIEQVVPMREGEPLPPLPKGFTWVLMDKCKLTYATSIARPSITDVVHIVGFAHHRVLIHGELLPCDRQNRGWPLHSVRCPCLGRRVVIMLGLVLWLAAALPVAVLIRYCVLSEER